MTGHVIGISSQDIAHTSEVTSTYSLHWQRYGGVQEQESEPLELMYFAGAPDRRPDSNKSVPLMRRYVSEASTGPDHTYIAHTGDEFISDVFPNLDGDSTLIQRRAQVEDVEARGRTSGKIYLTRVCSRVSRALIAR